MTKDEYLITDAPLKALSIFALPMILGSFFQQVYNMADSIIVGRFVGSSALAAVGACAALTNVFICVALGAGVGAGVLVSRAFGSRSYGKMKTIVSTSLISFLILSGILGVIGYLLSRPMMQLLQTPSDILDTAVLYLKIYFLGFPFLFMYNILSNMFTSIGESRVPLALLIFSSLLNIFMDLWMVVNLGMGVFGVALATLISQGISAIMSLLIFLRRMKRYEGAFVLFETKELRGCRTKRRPYLNTRSVNRCLTLHTHPPVKETSSSKKLLKQVVFVLNNTKARLRRTWRSWYNYYCEKPITH